MSGETVFITTYMPHFAQTYMRPEYQQDATDLALARYLDCNVWAQQFATANVPFNHAILMYALTFTAPYSAEVRQTSLGFVNPEVWIINNYGRFKNTLLTYDGSNPEEPGEGGGTLNPFESIRFVVSSPGQQTVTFTDPPVYYELFINGLEQDATFCTLNGLILTIPGTYEILPGDSLHVKYLTQVET